MRAEDKRYWSNAPLRVRRLRGSRTAPKILKLERACCGSWGPGWVWKRRARWRWAVRVIREQEIPL